MSKVAERKALEKYPELDGYIGNVPLKEAYNYARNGYSDGYDKAMQDIKQYVEKLIRYEEKEWGEHNVDFGLYTILGHIVKIEENE